ncbi:metallophosphoesterase [Alcaligenaceae bacterium B3P038]|nr:metallophosphoesterase [Alcaligenaceae bacterium B3P038]
MWPLRWSKAARIALAVVVLLAAEHHLITRNFFGTMASPEVPHHVLVVLGWAFGSLILLGILLLIRDIVGGITYAISHDNGKRVLANATLRTVLGVSAIVLSGVGVWQAVRVPDVKTIEIAMPGLPAAFDGYRIVQLTDLHASRLLQGPWMTEVVSRTNALKPDLTVITGDLVDGTVEARKADVLPLQQLRAADGVLAIPGNHEYYAEYVRWVPAFQRLGLRMLLNEHVTLTHAGQNLIVAGITDRAATTVGQPEPDLTAALAGTSKEDAVILLSHRPVGAVANAAAGVDLQLSGHTHGGQILGVHVVAQLANDGFVSGQYKVNDMVLYVSNGSGLWPGFPIRLGRPSEITEIVLRSAAKGH